MPGIWLGHSLYIELYGGPHWIWNDDDDNQIGDDVAFFSLFRHFLALSLFHSLLCFWLIFIKNTMIWFLRARSSLICDLNEVNLQTKMQNILRNW